MYQFGIGYNKRSKVKEHIEKERKTIAEFIVGETLIKVGNQYAWLCMGCYLSNQ